MRRGENVNLDWYFLNNNKKERKNPGTPRIHQEDVSVDAIH